MHMSTGMLWLDDSPARSMEEKILRAARYYQEKYGKAAQLCLVNQATITDETQVGAIQVIPASQVLPHHFWIGQGVRSA